MAECRDREAAGEAPLACVRCWHTRELHDRGEGACTKLECPCVEWRDRWDDGGADGT